MSVGVDGLIEKSRGHVPGQKFLDLAHRMIGDSGEDMRQVGFRIDAVEFGRTDQAVHGRGPIAARVRSCKHVVLPSERNRTQ